MIETLLLIFGAVLLTLPSLISHKKEAGRQALRSLVFVQGALGFALGITAAVFLVLGLTGASDAVKSLGALVWISRFLGLVVVVCVGLVIGVNLLIRLATLKAAAETRERAEKIFFSLFEFQTAAGFLCLILGLWILVSELLINPLLPG
jgi:hypothetical protein